MVEEPVGARRESGSNPVRGPPESVSQARRLPGSFDKDGRIRVVSRPTAAREAATVREALPPVLGIAHFTVARLTSGGMGVGCSLAGARRDGAEARPPN